MPVRTIEEQQEASCCAIVFICLLIAIIFSIEYAQNDNEVIKNKCKDWFVPCYSISGTFIFVQMLKKSCEQKNKSFRLESVPV